MEVKIENINTEEFKQDLTKALAKSAIGDVVMGIVENAASDYKVKEAISNVIRQHMTDTARRILATDDEFKKKLDVAVRSVMTADLLEKIASKVTVNNY